MSTGSRSEVRWRLPGGACHLGAWQGWGGAIALGQRRQEIRAGPGRCAALSLSALLRVHHPTPCPRAAMDATETGMGVGTGGPPSTAPQLLTQGAPLTHELPDSRERSTGTGRARGGLRTLETPTPRNTQETPAPSPPIALQIRHPGCLGEGAQEGEVAASASDYTVDGGRVSRPGSLQGAPGASG